MTTHLDDNALTMLASGEMPRVPAALAGWHLSRCADCRAQLTQTERLWTLAQTLREASVPSALKSKTLAAINRKETVPLSPRPAFRLRPTFAALAACLAAVSVALLWPGSPVRPLPAFADVEKAMSKVQSATWTAKLTSYPQDFWGMTEEFWVRRSPPAVASLTTEKRVGTYRTVQDAHRFASFFSKSNQYYTRSNQQAHANIARHVEQTLRALTELPQSGQTTEMSADGFDRGLETGFRITGAKFVRTVTPWKSETTILAGQSALKFTREVRRMVTRPKQSQSAGRTFHADTAQTIWADAKTLRVIRAEWRQSFDGRISLVSLRSNFRYDEPAPPGTFDLAPPPGATIKDEMDYARPKRRK